MPIGITKHKHAHIEVEVDGRRLVTGPGEFTPAVGGTNVDAIVITDAHDDHWTADHLATIHAQSPDARIFGPVDLERAADGFDVAVVEAGYVVG